MRKMKMRHIVMILAGIVLTACNKTPIPELPEGNDPIYTLTGQVDGEDLDYSVGLESVVMNRGVINESGLFSYYGEMESVTKNEKIRVEFIQLETPQSSTQMEVFNNSTVPFMVNELAKVRFDFGGFGGGQSQFFWLIENGAEVKPGDAHELAEYGYLKKTVRFNDVGNGDQHYYFTIKNGFENNELISGFSSVGGEDSIHLYSAVTYPMHEWYIDGLLVGTDANYGGPISTGVHRINHRVMDENSNVDETNRLVRFNGGKQIWELKVVYHEEYPIETNNYGRVVISMYKDGEWYSSEYAEENKGEGVSIENIKRVALEEGQLPLISYDIDFDAVLYNESKSESLTLSNMDGKFVVGLE